MFHYAKACVLELVLFELHCTRRLLWFVNDCNKECYYYYYYYFQLMFFDSFQREHLLKTHPMVHRLSASLVSVFVGIEMTGQGVEFEHKFKYRQPMYVALEYIWRIDSHRDALKVFLWGFDNDGRKP